MPELPDHPISSRRRYDHFGTSPDADSKAPFSDPKFGGGILYERDWTRGSELRAIGAAAGTLAIAVLGLQAGCTPEPSTLDQIRARNEIRVVTLNIPTCFYFGAQGTEGFEYKLAKQFAAELGVKLVMYPVATERAMQAELAAGRADIAAAQVTPNKEWRRVGEASIPYAQIAAARRLWEEQDAPSRNHAARIGEARRPRGQSAGADPRKAEEDGRADSAVGADSAE